MDRFTTTYARQLVERSKLKQLEQILKDIHSVAEDGETKLVSSYKFESITEIELRKLGFSIEKEGEFYFVKW